MSSIYTSTRTVSGEGLFRIKTDHKFSHSASKAKPMIDIEELNSGLYALRRLSSVLEAQINLSVLVDPTQGTFPIRSTASSFYSPKCVENTAPQTGSTVEEIKLATALELIQVIPGSIEQLIASVSALDLTKISAIVSALAVIAILKDRTTLTEQQVQAVFTSATAPTDAHLESAVKTQKADIIAAEKKAISERMTQEGATSEEIAEALKTYEEEYVSSFLTRYVTNHVQIHRKNIGEVTAVMIGDEALLLPPIPDPTANNVESVNAQKVLQAIISGLAKATAVAPELAGDPEVINLVTQLSPYITQTTLDSAAQTIIYNRSYLPSNTVLQTYLPDRDVAIYKESITAAYSTAIQNLATARKDIENLKQTLENQLHAVSQAISTFTNWIGAGQRLTNETIKYSSNIITEAMEAKAGLTCLSSMYHNLPSDFGSILNTYVPQYLQLTMNGGTVNDFIAKMTVFQELSEYCENNTVTSQYNLSSHLNGKGSYFRYVKFYEDVGTRVINIAANSSELTKYFQTTTQGGVSFFIPNFKSFIDNVIKINSLNANFSSSSKSILTNFTAAATAYTANLQSQINELTTQYERLDPGEAPFTTQRKTTVESWLEATNLGSAMIFLVLNSQLPKQQTFLEPLIQEINYNNLAANAVNDLLAITTAFPTTSVYYNLSSYLVQSKEGVDLFYGDYFETTTALAREREYISRDSDRCRRAQQLTDQLITKINALSGISSAQKSSMLNAAYMYGYILTITFDQLIILDALLLNLKIEAERKDGNYNKDVFKITGPTDWISVLSTLEGFVANGFSHNDPIAGLGPLYTQIQSDQQNYLTQSQTQQLNLQNQMTNVQQEWTLMSTSLQVLNSTLSHLAGEIYSN